MASHPRTGRGQEEYESSVRYLYGDQNVASVTSDNEL